MTIPVYAGDVPSLNQAQPEFDTNTQAIIDYIAELAPELNTFATDLNNFSTTATSVTSNTVGAGSKSFTTQTGKSYSEGQSLTIARTAAPTNRMFAVVESYNSGTGALVVTSQAFNGSGTFTDWTITLGFNGVIGTGQIEALSVTNAELANAYINDLTAVTFDPLVDYLPIADGSDSGNKKKAYINAYGLGDSKEVISDTGANGTRTLTLDGVIREVTTLAARTSTIDGGTTLYPEFKCRAWISFNGTGTPAIRGSGNVTSITDNGVGDHTINLTTALPDANYSFVATSQRGAGTSISCVSANEATAPTASALRIINNTQTGAASASADSPYTCLSIFR